MKDQGSFYDKEELDAVKRYEQNPEALFATKERMSILAQIVRENPIEAKFAAYLKMALVDGYSVREIARIEGVASSTVQERIKIATKFLRKKVAELKQSEKKVRK